MSQSAPTMHPDGKTDPTGDQQPAPDDIPATSEALSRDAELLNDAARGDVQSFRELYQRLSPAAYSLACRITGNEADADDVLVEAFHQAWVSAPRYDPARATVTGWLLNITRSRAIDTVRARVRRLRRTQEAADPSSGWTFPAPADPEAEAILSENRHRLHRALDILEPSQRTAVELAYYGGLSHSEIARRLGEPLGTIKTRIRLAMKKIRQAISNVVDKKP